METKLGCGKKWVGKILLWMCLLLVMLDCEATTISDDSASSIQKHLKSMNKPPVKSIKSADGDIIDCVDILHQSAFNHPDLKNHKIQMRPSFHPKGSTFEVSNMSSNSKPLRQLWHKSGRCPDGTIPIRRTKNDEILRAKSINFHHPKSVQLPSNLYNISAGHEHAIVYVIGDKYYGARATINIWNPQIQEPINEFSLSQIWVLAGSLDNKDLNSIEAGWMVNPKLFGDNRTRLFTYWTRDAYTSTGCYNIRCPGFIQTSDYIALGATIHPDSIYASSQYHIDILIWKDPISGNWWLRYGNHNLGYWPASLFTYLRDSASSIEWGGEVVNTESDGHHTTTQMGSGHFPYEGYRKASYFNKIQIVDGDNKLRDPTDLSTIIDKENCYSIKTGRSSHWGNYFYYGGPGRNPNCP